MEGIAYKPLFAQAGFSDSTRLERREAGTSPGLVEYPEGAGFYVLAGERADDQAVYAAGTWLRFPVGGIHEPLSSPGCTLYAKHGGLAYLRGADD